MNIGALIVGNNILSRAFDDDIEVTPMKLQKLLYFVASEYATVTGKSLVSESFEAWEYGSAVRSVHDKFRPFAGKPINVFAKDAMGKARKVDESARPEVAHVIDSVWRLGKHLSPVELARLTQRPGSAWFKAWGTGLPIRLDDMAADVTYRDRLGIEYPVAA